MDDKGVRREGEGIREQRKGRKVVRVADTKGTCFSRQIYLRMR
jgi:hypothetical protein